MVKERWINMGGAREDVGMMDKVKLTWRTLTLVQESIAYQCMDLKNPRISTRISMIFGSQSSIINTSVDIHIQGYPCMDILQWISVNIKHPLIDIHVL